MSDTSAVSKHGVQSKVRAPKKVEVSRKFHGVGIEQHDSPRMQGKTTKVPTITSKKLS